MMLNKRRTTLHIKVGNVTRPVAQELSPEGAADDNSSNGPKDKQEEALDWWYMSRKEIMENSPSRKDGIDWKKESSFRKSYCTFLQDFGMRLKVPQITIATAIVFCHRFFLRQSHAKNDRWTIATACMFLAGKVEETPSPLKEVIHISYEIIHKKDPTAVLRIKQKEVYEQQKELILLGEKVVLITLGFAFDVQHPYKPLIEAIKLFNVAKPQLAQVAWNFVNDGLRTSLCLQFKPHQIAAGSIFLAAKFLKVKLPSDGAKVWWQELGVTARQLEEVSNQMLELYEQNRVPTSEGSEVERSAGGGAGATAKASAVNEEQAPKQVSSDSAPKHSSAESLEVQLRGTGNQSTDESAEVGSDITDHKLDLEIRDGQNSEQLPQKDNKGEVTNRSCSGTEQVGAGDQDRTAGTDEAAEVTSRDDSASNKSSCNVDWHLELREGLLRHSLNEVMKMIDKNKVKAALEKRRKERGGKMTLKKDVLDEDDLIERELEDGIELAVEDEKNKERRQSWSSPDHADNDEDHDKTRDVKHKGMEGHSQDYMNVDNTEEGKMIDDASSLPNDRKGKVGSPLAGQPAAKKVT